jgi:phosphatidylinositol-3-phosphatase
VSRPIVLALMLVVSCAGPSSVTTPSPASAAPSPSESPASVPPAATTTPTPPLPHVFVIVMENASLATAQRSPSVQRLAGTYALATNYHAVSSPSLPNYLALTSGSTWGVTDDAYHVLPAGGLGLQLTAAGIGWRAYMEGLTDGGCLHSPYPYALKHNPFAYYGGTCPPNVVSLDGLDADLVENTPTFVWVTPGLCHDGHDCSFAIAGPWLEDLVARIVASAAWRNGGVLFIVWDEGDGGSSSLVPLIVAAQGLGNREIGGAYDHYSLLGTVEDLLALPRLGAAQNAHALTDLLPRTTR